MQDYQILKELNSLLAFKEAIKKLTIWSSKNDGTTLNETEKSFLLSCAILLLRNYDLNKTNKAYAEFAYYIILKYAVITNDFSPLYDFSVNFGFYPIANALAESKQIETTGIISYNAKARIEEEFKYNNLIETYQQKKIRNLILKSDSNEICFIAPTSYGKSSLIIDDIKLNLSKRKTVSVVVPTKSLITQTFRSLKKEKFNQKIIIHDEMYEGEERFLSVLTQERALRLLMKNENLYFDILYIDEAHNLFSNDARNILLSRLIRLNRQRNPIQKVIYLSPLISSGDNLKFFSEQNIVEQRIDFNIKEPEIYELCLDLKVQKYNRFVDIFYFLNQVQSHFEYILNSMKGKNFFFLTAPKKIEEFSKELYNHLSLILDDEDLKTTMKNLSKYIHEDFYGIHYLNKGIVYLHGKLPDNIKDYLEYKFQNLANMRYLVANTVILEGINLPIDCLFILNTHGLTSEKLTNLIGRVNRLNMIFGSKNIKTNLLLPEIHFINTRKYARANSKMSKKISGLRTGKFADKVENPLLLEFNIEQYKPDTKRKKIEEAIKIIKEENFVLNNESQNKVEIIKKRMIELGMNTIYVNDIIIVDHWGCGQKPGLSIIPGGIACFPMKRELKPLTYSYSTI